VQDGSRRDLVLAGVAAAILVTANVVESTLHALLVALAAFVALPVVSWGRTAHYVRLKHRMAGAATAGFVGFAIAFLVVAKVGAVMFVLGAAVVLLGIALGERARLRGAVMPAEGEARGRVAFEGTIHALGAPIHVPGTDDGVAVWIARYGRKRWTSKHRFEVRRDARRVLVDPGALQLRVAPAVMSGSSGERAVRALGGAIADLPSLADPVRVWSFRDGDQVYVVGGVTLEDDPAAPSLRDPSRVSVFTAKTLVGRGALVAVRRAADMRVLLCSAIAISAGLLVAAGLEG
jgi:hypothetical protein